MLIFISEQTAMSSMKCLIMYSQMKLHNDRYKTESFVDDNLSLSRTWRKTIKQKSKKKFPVEPVPKSNWYIGKKDITNTHIYIYDN